MNISQSKIGEKRRAGGDSWGKKNNMNFSLLLATIDLLLYLNRFLQKLVILDSLENISGAFSPKSNYRVENHWYKCSSTINTPKQANQLASVPVEQPTLYFLFSKTKSGFRDWDTSGDRRVVLTHRILSSVISLFFLLTRRDDIVTHSGDKNQYCLWK